VFFCEDLSQHARHTCTRACCTFYRPNASAEDKAALVIYAQYYFTCYRVWSAITNLNLYSAKQNVPLYVFRHQRWYKRYIIYLLGKPAAIGKHSDVDVRTLYLTSWIYYLLNNNFYNLTIPRVHLTLICLGS